MVFGPIVSVIEFAWSPVEFEFCWHSLSFSQWKHMSIAFDCLGVIFALMTTSAMALSVCMGVAGCLCPISSYIILMYTASLAII